MADTPTTADETRDPTRWFLAVALAVFVLIVMAFLGTVTQERAACRLMLRDAHSTADSIAIVKARSTCASVLP